MATLPPETIRELLNPYIESSCLTDSLIAQLSTYLDLLLRWNARVNLTAIRQPEEIVRRHFGESLFAGQILAPKLNENAELLDYGSGAGFPGVPIQLLLPKLQVTLAESQSRKVAFLREVARALELQTEIWPRRVEDLPPSRRFDAVTLRAVDHMPLALDHARQILRDGGWMAALVGREVRSGEIGDPNERKVFHVEHSIPESENRRLVLRQSVPRGTFGF